MSKSRRRSRPGVRADSPEAAGKLPIPVDAYATYYLLFLLVLCSAFFFNFILNHPIWSEFDEIANYDYIDRLSDGHFPIATEDISEYTLEITRNHFAFQHPLGWAGTVDSMGLAGKSYQAQQPPFYSLLLAPLNFVLKAVGTSPPRQITILRATNLLWLLAAAVLAILTVDELHEISGWDRLYGYFLAVLVMVFGFNLRGHVGADVLPPLVVGAFFYLTVRLWRTNRQELVTWSALAAALAFLTKYTTGLCFLVWGLSTLFFWKRNPELTWRRRIIHCTPFLLVALYLAFNVWRAGDPLNTAATDKLFAGALPRESSAVAVLGYLFETSLDLNPAIKAGPMFFVAPLLLILFHYAVSFCRVFVQRSWSAIPVFVACQISVAIIVAVLLMCGYKPGFWFTFRIHSGFTLPWMIALTATPLLFESAWVRWTSATAGILMATFCVYVRA